MNKDVNQAVRTEYGTVQANLTSKLTNFVNLSVKRGTMDKLDAYAHGNNILAIAIANNRGIELIVPEDGPPRFELRDTPLSTILMNKDGTTPPNNEPNVASSVAPEATATEQTPITSSSLEQELLNNQPGSAKAETIIAKLMQNKPGYVRPKGY